jgi:GNAT superfamily N-acetyltransferase
MQKPRIISVRDEAGVKKYASGFIKTYKEAFAGPPYFESFEDEEVMTIFRELVFNSGSVCLLIEEEEVFGLAGGYALNNEPEIASIFGRFFPEIKPERIFYFAELAVQKEYRRCGYGSELIKNLSQSALFTACLQRTQAEGSNALNIFQNQGFEVVRGMTQNVETYISSDNGRKKVRQKRIFTIKFA